MRRKKRETENPIPTITRTHKIRIYPNKHNQEVFQKYYDYQRSVWNRAIDERNAQYKIYKEMKATGLYTQKELNKNYFPHTNNLRKKMKKFDWENNFHCRVREVQFDNLCQAWNNFFNPNMPNHQKPKYKKKKEIESHKKISLRGVRTKDKWLLLPKALKSKPEYRFTKIKMAQELRFNGKITSDFSVSVENNKWYVIITVEMPLEDVPLVQKRAIELARRAAKPVIVATQVMDSMIKNPRPTRAEASDCANAILDGADAVMLSGETSVGAFPIEAVRTMARIVESTEENGGERIAALGPVELDRASAICGAAAVIAEKLDARFLVTFTQSGTSARMLSRLRTPIPMLAFTPLESTRRQLALSWGIQAYRVPEVAHTDDMVWQVDQVAQSARLAEVGDEMVIVAGMPPGTPGSSNLLRVHRLGDEVDYVIGGSRGDA